MTENLTEFWKEEDARKDDRETTEPEEDLTEKPQNADNQSSVKNEVRDRKVNWIGLVEQGGELPTPEDKVGWIGFKNAWRGWYRESLNPSAHPDTRAENRARFDMCVDHFESLGYEVTPIRQTKSVALVKRDSNMYDSEGKVIPEGEDATGATTGWTVYSEEEESIAA